MRKILQYLSTLLYKIFTFNCETSYSFSRYAMYESIKKSFPSEYKTGDALSISHSKNLLELVGYESTTLTERNYPEDSIFDIQSDDESYDFVVSDQVFEHINGKPSDAIQEVMRVLKPGGIMLHTTCMFVPIHGKDDFWRFTPQGLSDLVSGCGASCLVSCGVGHPVHFMLNLIGWTHLPVPKNKKHPLNWLARLNRESYPNVVWVIAKKPE